MLTLEGFNNLIENPDSYSRILNIELILELHEDDDAINFLALWAYAEHFSQNEKPFDDKINKKIKDLVKKAAKDQFYRNTPMLGLIDLSDKKLKRLPHLSARAMDFLHQHFPDVTYLQHTETMGFSTLGLQRWAACSSPVEILKLWTGMIMFDKGLQQAGQDNLGKRGLTNLFEKYCLSAPGVFIYGSVEGQALWDALYNSPFDLSGLRRAFLKEMILHVTSDENLKITLRSLSGLSKRTPRAFIDMAMVLTADKLKIFLDKDLKDGIKIICDWLKPSSLLDKEDRIHLLKQTSSLLLPENLESLAKDYAATSDWVMFQLIKQQRLGDKCDQYERTHDAALKTNWPICYKNLENLIVQMENANKGSQYFVFQNLSAIVSQTPLPLFSQAVVGRLPTAVNDQLLPIQTAMKHVYPLLEEGSLELDKSNSGLIGAVCAQHKKDFPGETKLSFSSLPLVLRERLTALKPQIEAAAGAKPVAVPLPATLEL